jgi:hypothetical protein
MLFLILNHQIIKYYKQQLNILMLLLSQIVSLKFNKIYRIFRKTFFTFRARWIAEAYTNFIKKRFYQIKFISEYVQ